MIYMNVYEGMIVIVHYYTIKWDPGCPFKLYAYASVGKNFLQLEIVLIQN